MIEQKFCKECGAEVGIHISYPEEVYRITTDGDVERDDNNDVFFGPGPHVEILCSNDIDHITGINENDSKWFKNIQEELEKKGIIEY